MARWLLGLMLCLFGLPAQAQYQCLPKELGGTGIYLSRYEDAWGYSMAWLCPVAGKPSGQWLIRHRTVLNNYVAAPGSGCELSLPVMKAALAASSALDAVNAMVAKCDNAPASSPVATADWTNYETLRLNSIQLVRTKWKADNPDTGPVWRTPKAGTFRLYQRQTNRLGTVILGRNAPPDALCDCAAPVPVGSSTYCSLSGQNVNEVTLCIRPTP